MAQEQEDCNHRFEKIVQIAEKEIAKIDEFRKNYNTVGDTVAYELSREEKKKMIDNIMENSRTCRMLIDELKMHRTEVKYLLSAFNKLTHRFERLKRHQQDQMKKIEEVNCVVQNELVPLMSAQEKRSKLEKEKVEARVAENKDLEETYKKLEAKILKLINENNVGIEQYEDRLLRIKDENNRDKIIFCLVSKYIKKAFEIQAKLKCRNVNLVDYAFTDTD